MISSGRRKLLPAMLLQLPVKMISAMLALLTDTCIGSDSKTR